MPKPRIRLPFLGAFVLLVLGAAYLGLLPNTTPTTTPTTPPSTPLYSLPNDKLLHFSTFLLLTLTFYWILDTSRRRQTHITLVTCTGFLGVGSEFLQAVIPNGREFDVWDVGANVVGSLLALSACGFFHGRLLERRRSRGRYGVIAQQEDGDGDLELGVIRAEDIEEQESGVVDTTTVGTMKGVEAELDHWDENEADKWDDDDDKVEGNIITPSSSSVEQDVSADSKKRVD